MERTTTIRKGRAEDAEWIAAATVEVWHAAYGGLMPADLLAGLEAEGMVERWRGRLEDPPGHWTTWVAEVDGVFAGYCTVAPCRDPDVDPDRVAEIQVLNIRPEFWRLGLGNQFLMRAFDTLRRSSYQEVTLWCLAGNRRAEQFYAAAGFHPDGPLVLKSHSGHELSHLRFRRPLSTTDHNP